MTFDFVGPIAYASFFLVIALLNALVCLGLNLQWGQSGLFNVGVAGFIAIGAYVSALLTTPPSDSHFGGLALPIAFGWFAAMACAGLASAVIGALTLRLRADYLAITTFGVAVIVQLVALNAQKLTGGAFGVAFIPRPFDRLGATPALYNLANLGLISGVVGVVYLALERLVRSPWGRVLRAIREDERAAMALGKSPTRYRLEAFALGGALASAAGVMLGLLVQIRPYMGFDLLLPLFAAAILGGIGSALGAFAGALIIGFGEAATVELVGAEWRAAVAFLILIAVLIVRPTGLAGRPT